MKTDAQSFLEKVASTPHKQFGAKYMTSTICPITFGTGFVLPIGVVDSRPSIEFKKKIQEEIKI